MLRLAATLMVVMTFSATSAASAPTYAERINEFLMAQAPSHLKNPQVIINGNYRKAAAKQCDTLVDISSPQPIKWPGRGLIEVQCDQQPPLVLPIATDFDRIAWQVTTAVNRGALLADDVIAPVMIKASAAPHNMASSKDHWQGKIAKRFLSAGAPLKLSDITEPVAVKRGQRVSLLAQFGKVKATMIATAMQDGRIGDSVSVKINNSQRVLQGVVVDNGTVSVNSRTKRMGTIAIK